MERQSIAAQTLYAELLERLLAARVGDAAPGDGPGGTLVAKTIRGKKYWYAQRKELGATRQTYVGPDTPEVRALIARRREAWAGADEERRQRERLAAMLVAGGAATVTATEARVIALLAEARVFELGAVLVGTQAFASLANVLGVRWPASLGRTADVDVAHPLHVEVAVADAEGPTLAAQLAMKDAASPFAPIPPFDRRHPSTSFRVRGTELRLDLLTPLVGRPRTVPVFVPALGAAAQPLRFLDYLLDDPLHAALVGRDGVLVRIPNPARFALHKLIVAAERGGVQQAKVQKDLAQAEALLAVLVADRPGDLALAWEALAARGTRWVARVRRSLARCDAALVAQARRAGVEA